MVQLLPPHILRQDPHTICTMVKRAIDTCFFENHELLDAEARTLTYTSEQALSDYVQKHREPRHRMQVSEYPNIEAERTTVRHMVQGLAHHPHMHALAMMLACNPPNTIREFTNHIHQMQLIQKSAPAPTPQKPQPYRTTNTSGQKTHSLTFNTTRKPAHALRHYDKPTGNTGIWCHTHGCVTHSTSNCYTRRHRTRPQLERANQSTAILEDRQPKRRHRARPKRATPVP